MSVDSNTINYVMTERLKLTSVKVNEEEFLKFKQQALQDNFTFKKLVDKALSLYLTDSNFRKLIQEKN